MSDAQYINTKQIRQDLLGFLQALADGERFIVVNRSKPVVKLSGELIEPSTVAARQNMQQFLQIAEAARNSATKPKQAGDDLKHAYYVDMAQKYGISGY